MIIRNKLFIYMVTKKVIDFILCYGFGQLVIDVGKLDLRCMFVFTFLGLDLLARCYIFGKLLYFFLVRSTYV
jgi:hypothetical protein